MSKEKSFRCPKCGSDMFGTSNCTGPKEAMVGHCHGEPLVSNSHRYKCDFSWPRSDDNLYFKDENND